MPAGMLKFQEFINIYITSIRVFFLQLFQEVPNLFTPWFDNIQTYVYNYCTNLDKEVIMKRYLISLGITACALALVGCSYDDASCTSVSCGYVKTTGYVPTTTYVAKTTYVPTTKYVPTTTYIPVVTSTQSMTTCNRCGNGYDYGYSSYNTGWY